MCSQNHSLVKGGLPILPWPKETTFSTDLGDYKIQETADGQWTVWSGHFDETSHSKWGAGKETLHCYLEGTNLIKKCEKQDTIHIIEIGFGVGLAFELTQNYLKEKLEKTRLIYTAFEIDEQLVLWGMKHFPSTLQIIDRSDLKVSSGDTFNNLKVYQACSSKHPQHQLQVIVGDARQTMPLYAQQLKKENGPLADAIFQDAFSFQKNTKLWTNEWFTLLYQLMASNGILTTFSRSTRVRKSMAQAGFKLHEVPAYEGMVRKGGPTLAKVYGDHDPNVWQKLQRSPVQALQDSDL